MKVSVVIPTHNRADMLPRALDSVLAQTYEDFEVIVVSDGSTDGTEAVLEKYSAADGRVKYISYSPAGGASHARNVGIEASRGGYIAFLDDDDEWLPEKLALQAAVLDEREEVGLVQCGIEMVFDDMGCSDFSMPVYQGNLSEKIFMKNCMKTTSVVMLRKSILEKRGLFDESFPARNDYDLWIRVCQEAETAIVDRHLVKNHNDLGREQISNDISRYVKAMGMIREKYAWKYDTFSPEQMMRYEEETERLLAKRCLRNNLGREARKYIFSSLKKRITLQKLFFLAASFVDYRQMVKLRSSLGKKPIEN